MEYIFYGLYFSKLVWQSQIVQNASNSSSHIRSSPNAILSLGSQLAE